MKSRGQTDIDDIRVGDTQIAIVDAATTSNLPAPFNRNYSWGEIFEGQKWFPCHKAQLDVLKSTAKYTFAFAGSGGGKTSLLPLWIFKRLQECEQAGIRKPRILVVTPNSSIYKNSELNDHLQSFFRGTVYHGTWNKMDKTYLFSDMRKFDEGAGIYVRTLGDGNEYFRLQGGTYHAIVCDEVALFSEKSWNEVRTRSGKNDAKVLCVTTPTINGWLYEVMKKWKEGDRNYFIKTWATSANPAYNKEHLDREKKSMSYAQFARNYLGEFSTVEGLVFEQWGNPQTYPLTQKKLIPSIPKLFFGGIDFGYSPDPTCILMIAECEDGNFYVVDEVFEHKKTPEEVAVLAVNLRNKWVASKEAKEAYFLPPFQRYYADKSRPDIIETIKRLDCPVLPNKIHSINTGLMKIDAAFRLGRLIVMSRCSNLVRELKEYSWDKKISTEQYKEVPKGGNDHAIDALRYAFANYTARIKSFDENKIIVPTDEEQKKMLEEQGIILTEENIKRKEEQQRASELHKILWSDDERIWTTIF